VLEPDASCKQLAAQDTEVAALKEKIHKMEWQMRRMESLQDKVWDVLHTFATDIATTSAASTLGEFVDLGTLEPIGAGNFGYVFSCVSRGVPASPVGRRRSFAGGPALESQSGQRLVVKLQGVRLASTVAKEWHHGSNLGQHQHIVAHHHVLLHQDVNAEIRFLLQRSFETGVFTGKRPKQFPDRYFCMIEEHMDGGSVQDLMDQELLGIEAVGAVTRQIADALVYIHMSLRIHNDVKPDNILLKSAPSKDFGFRCFTAKLADLGSMEFSGDRSRDVELFAYTIWCMALNETFKNVPPAEDRADAVCKLQECTHWADQKELRSKLPATVAQLWEGDESGLTTMKEAKWLQNCNVLLPQSVILQRGGKKTREDILVESLETTSCGG